MSNKYVFSFLIKKRHYVIRKEKIYIYTDYLKYFSNSNLLENGFIYIYISALDPLFYFWTGKLLIDKPTTYQFLRMATAADETTKAFGWAAKSF